MEQQQQQHSPTPSLDTMKLYLREEGLTALQRIRGKILGAAGVAAVGSTLWATASNRRVGRVVPALTANAAIAMTGFAVCQEVVRGVRLGEDDGWNSFAAGAVTGAALSRITHGRGFHLLGALLWGPLCGSLHWANKQLQTGALLQTCLIKLDLLDAPQQQQQQQQQQVVAPAMQPEEQQIEQQQQHKVPRKPEDLTMREKVLAVEAIKQRELEELHNRWREEEQAVLAAGLEKRRQQEQKALLPEKKGWLLW